MKKRKIVNIDGNTACAHVAHAVNEVIAIYPITPSSVMGELADEKSARGEKNIWGVVPVVSELQSEGGAAGAVHGALSLGSLTTTFTASQGLLLMIPNMYKIAGECTPTVFHVSARAVATHALSIFGDHSDVMACRGTGWIFLASNNPQEVMDFSLIAQNVTLRSRIPVLHFFDGFRTSHEMAMVEELTFDDMRFMINDDLVRAHRQRGLSPDRPTIKGTSQNPDVFFQGRERANLLYDEAAEITRQEMKKFAALTGRSYKTVEYIGAPDAEYVITLLGSGADTAEEAVAELNSRKEKYGLLKVRLFMPFPADDFINALPKTVKKLSVLDRTKEPSSFGEPFYQTVRAAIGEAELPIKVFGGRFGLGSKDFTPAMVKAVFDNMRSAKPISSFSVGIEDDLTKRSLTWDKTFITDQSGVYNALFCGLGSDGTVGANKNTAKIVCGESDKKVQAYFVYDSKKSGSLTTSHVRFSDKLIKSSYLIQSADFIACHNFTFLEHYDILSNLKIGGVFLLNSPYSKDEVWGKLPDWVKGQLIKSLARFYVIDAVEIGERIGLGGRINMILQAAFFKISKVIPIENAKAAMIKAIKKTYGKYGEKTVEMNIAASEEGFEKLYEVIYPKTENYPSEFKIDNRCSRAEGAPELVRNTIATLIAGEGERIKVSELPLDGTWTTGTTRYEKRNIAVNIPVWDKELCTQCAICSFVCPHAAIRIKTYPAPLLDGAPAAFKSSDTKDGQKFTVQIAPEDCTGCSACVNSCPATDKIDRSRKALVLSPQPPLKEAEAENFDFFLTLPHAKFPKSNIKGIEHAPHLFEFSGACAGCGETPYVRLLAQLFGDRLIVANATGCSSIYGGNLPTTPYTVREDGRGPAWSNSLFEDNAEFGLGMRLAADHQRKTAAEELSAILPKLGDLSGIAEHLLAEDGTDEETIECSRADLEKIKEKAAVIGADNFLSVADHLIKKSVWILGGDGWAYDIGYGGLDHVIASGENVNILVLDTEVYSNTGGQSSKSTPMGANAKFASIGKRLEKKDLGMIAMTYGRVYVAHVSLSNPAQCIKAFIEAENYHGPSLIIAYSHCIAHGIDMAHGVEEQRKAVQSGYWTLYRFDPRLIDEGKNPLQLDTKKVSGAIEEFMNGENRFRITKKQLPDIYPELAESASKNALRRFKILEQLAGKLEF
ncbi:MAG: pyruvate:ferredoxin (flavodoxin) oxidoreductase [Deferribacteraceae bacterium]|jgi:pyruvate-ferredoxin/flavodoxin oxidoreductase|nr:pyruvate:ferredoxin (flavodoxin) oxidoreductase [Deferribacteraceae bacterium]